MTRRPILRPLLGLVVLLMAFAVVAMHQMGAGHQPPMSAGHAMAALGPGADTGMTSMVGQQPPPAVSERGCGDGCADGGHEPPMAGHVGSMLCLAVLPLLLALVARRRALLTGWLRVLGRVGTAAAVLTRPVVLFPGPPRSCFIRLCVSRT